MDFDQRRELLSCPPTSFHRPNLLCNLFKRQQHCQWFSDNLAAAAASWLPPSRRSDVRPDMLARARTRRARPPRSGNSRCRLLELPCELRLQIFDEALKHSVDEKGSTKTVGHLRPSLLRTCRSIHDEAKPILYATTKSITIRVPSQFCTGDMSREIGCTKCLTTGHSLSLTGYDVDLCGIRELLSRFPGLNDFWLPISAPLPSMGYLRCMLEDKQLRSIIAMRDVGDGKRWKCYIESSNPKGWKTYFPVHFTKHEKVWFNEGDARWLLWDGSREPEET